MSSRSSSKSSSASSSIFTSQYRSDMMIRALSTPSIPSLSFSANDGVSSQIINNHHHQSETLNNNRVEVDPYHILDLRRDATKKEIIKAYRRLAILNHPRRNLSRQNTSLQHSSSLHNHPHETQQKLTLWKFIVLAACYETLSNDVHKRRYDIMATRTLYESANASPESSSASPARNYYENFPRRKRRNSNQSYSAGTGPTLSCSSVATNSVAHSLKMERKHSINHIDSCNSAFSFCKGGFNTTTSPVNSITGDQDQPYPRFFNDPTDRHLDDDFTEPTKKMSFKWLKRRMIDAIQDNTNNTTKGKVTTTTSDYIHNNMDENTGHTARSIPVRASSINSSNKNIFQCKALYLSYDDEEDELERRRAIYQGDVSFTTLDTDLDEDYHEGTSNGIIGGLLNDTTTTSVREETDSLFGGPLAPLYKARNHEPFTDPFIIFETEFGCDIFRNCLDEDDDEDGDVQEDKDGIMDLNNNSFEISIDGSPILNTINTPSIPSFSKWNVGIMESPLKGKDIEHLFDSSPIRRDSTNTSTLNSEYGESRSGKKQKLTTGYPTLPQIPIHMLIQEGLVLPTTHHSQTHNPWYPSTKVKDQLMKNGNIHNNNNNNLQTFKIKENGVSITKKSRIVNGTRIVRTEKVITDPFTGKKNVVIEVHREELNPNDICNTGMPQSEDDIDVNTPKKQNSGDDDTIHQSLGCCVNGVSEMIIDGNSPNKRRSSISSSFSISSPTNDAQPQQPPFKFNNTTSHHAVLKKQQNHHRFKNIFSTVTTEERDETSETTTNNCGAGMKNIFGSCGSLIP